MRVLPTSVRARLTLWYTLALTLPLVAFAVVAYGFVSHAIHTRTEAFVADALSVVERELGAERRAGPTVTVAIRRTLDELRFSELDILVLDEAGGVVGESHPVGGETEPGDPEDSTFKELVRDAGPDGLLGTEPYITTLSREGNDYRLLARSVELEGRQYHLVGIYPMADVEALLRRIQRLFLLAIPLIVLWAAGGGFFLVRRGFAPVAAMAARAAEIGGSNLGERLPVADDNELGDLARVLNDLLDRLERAFDQQRRFMADASHELRTPAAIIRAEADVTLSREERAQEEYRLSMGTIREAAGRLSRVVEDLFLAARADADHLTVGRQPVFLDELVQETVRAVQQLGDERGVRIASADLPAAPLLGDADLLNRLILNLLDNAIRHSPAGGVVDVSIDAGRAACRLDVSDQGSGIPPEAVPHIFDRFFQVDRARGPGRTGQFHDRGAGLGLAIARRIALLHGGDLELASSQPGRTVFRLTLPMASEDAP